MTAVVMSDVSLHLGDCRDVLPTLASGSVDVVLCDPPYPEIDREYGRMTEGEWHAMMRVVVPECRRVLKPSGSAVFILQPNYERIGNTRLWLWDFVAWAGREWNLIEDVYWWNYTSIPNAGTDKNTGLLRRSIKFCVWLGNCECYRDQSSVLWRESQSTIAVASNKRYIGVRNSVSGNTMDSHRAHLTAIERGGVTPFNLLPVPQTQFGDNAGVNGHGAGTPEPLMDWWIRYICPPGGVVCDPFMGSGTTGLAALRLHRSFIGIEKREPYFELSRRRLDGPPAPLFDERPPAPDPHPLFAEADA